MTDPYKPKLDALVLSAEEAAAIKEALATSKPWDWAPGGQVEAAIKSAKDKIRDHHLLRHGGRCCYCRTRLKEGGHFVIDREHILPKSKDVYRGLTFTLWNLAASCKRCNMQYKRNRDDFVVDYIDSSYLMNSSCYLFIHPNFDFYRDHIEYTSVDIDDRVLVKYTVLNESKKGSYTYNYFNLRGLEENQFDRAQGASVADEPLTELAVKVYELALDRGADGGDGSNYKYGTVAEEYECEEEQEDGEDQEDNDAREDDDGYDYWEEECGTCNGTGNGTRVNPYSEERMKCSDCNGTGYIICYYRFQKVY